MQTILHRKIEGTMTANINLLLTTIFNLSKDRLERFAKLYCHYYIATIKTKPVNKDINLGSFIRINKTSEGVVKFFEGEFLKHESS